MNQRIVSSSLLSITLFVGPTLVTADELADINNESELKKLLQTEDQLQLLAQHRTVLPQLAAEVETFSLHDARSGRLHKLSFDGYGERVDLVALRQQDRLVKRQLYCALEPDFYDRVVAQPTGTVNRLLFQMAVQEPELDKSEVDAERIDQVIGPLATEIRHQTEEYAAEFFTLALQDREVPAPQIRAAFGPFIEAELSREQLLDVYCEDKFIYIGEIPPKEDPPLDVALACKDIQASLPSTGTDLVHQLGYDGSGVRIAVVEDGGNDHPDDCFNLAATRTPGVAGDAHVTNSYAMIGNTFDGAGSDICDGPLQGYAPGADVLAANTAGTNQDYMAQYGWSVQNGVNVVTMSWGLGDEGTGNLAARDKFFDYAVVRYPFPSVFSAAGNFVPFVFPKGYNYFAVGNIENNADGDICDDAIVASSAVTNPTYAVRELPEIAAPGSRHCLLNRDFGGTSAAAPVVASIASLVMSSNPSLKYWPEAVRAILMASAGYQMADGSAWTADNSPDGADGVGMVDAFEAVAIAQRRQTSSMPANNAHDFGSMTENSFDGSGAFSKSWSVAAPDPGRKIRVALTWDSLATNDTNTMLDLDLDLRVYDQATGAAVAWSLSAQNNYEFVEFVPTAGHTYTITISISNPPADFSRYYAIAWNYHNICP